MVSSSSQVQVSDSDGTEMVEPGSPGRSEPEPCEGTLGKSGRTYGAYNTWEFSKMRGPNKDPTIQSRC